MRPSISLLFLLAVLPISLFSAVEEAPKAPEDHCAGIALLASNVGNDYAVDDLVAFVKAGRFKNVIVDWAWITAHWKRTSFKDVDELVKRLKTEKIEVAAMYRPRFFASQEKETGVKFQVKDDGTPVDEKKRAICFSDKAARAWGSQWAVDILTKCPSFDRVIIYNPQDQCSCESCRASAKKHDDSLASVRTFLGETRDRMREVRKDAKIGAVVPPSPKWYKSMSGSLDLACPYLFVLEEAKFEEDMKNALACLKETKEAGPALAKITWGPKDKVSDRRLAEFVSLAKKNRIPYCFWTFETTFLEGTYDIDKLCEALGIDAADLKPVIERLKTKRRP